MWIFIERIVLLLGAIVLGKQVTGLLKDKNQINPLKLYSLTDVSGMLGIKTEDINELVKSGQLSVKEVGDKNFVLGKDLLKFLS